MMPRMARRRAPEPDPPAEPIAEPATKSERTRLRIRDAAFSLFVELGYEATTMRAIAARAGCALGLIYRYFPRREDLVVELYRDLEAQTRAAWATLPAGSVAARVAAALRIKVALAWPHRAAFRAITAAVLDRSSTVGVFSDETAAIREAVRTELRQLVLASSDAPSARDTEHLVEALFVMQLTVLLAATQDPNEDGRATDALITTLGDMTQTFRPFLGLAAPLLARLATHVRAFERPAP